MFFMNILTYPSNLICYIISVAMFSYERNTFFYAFHLIPLSLISCVASGGLRLDTTKVSVVCAACWFNDFLWLCRTIFLNIYLLDNCDYIHLHNEYKASQIKKRRFYGQCIRKRGQATGA